MSARTSRRRPGTWGTAEQLPSGRWRAFYRVNGAKFSAPQPFPTKADAQAWLAMERADRSRGTWHDPRAGRVTLADYTSAWLESRPDLSPRTRDTYQRSINRWILPRVTGAGNIRGIELGAIHVSDLSPATVRAWYASVFTSARDTAARRQTIAAERREDPARAWARLRGFEVAATGRLPEIALRAWRAAGEPRDLERVDPRRPVVAPDNAGRTSAAQAYRVLRTILGTAVHDGLLPSNPCQIPGAGVVHHRERLTANPSEVAELARLVPPDLSAAVLVAAWSGLRYGELFALSRRHLDSRNGTLTVDRALVCVPGQPIKFGNTKTVKSNRRVTLPAFVADALRNHVEHFVPDHPDALLFGRPDGSPVSSLYLSGVFRRARRVIGRDDLTWHDQRHTGATLAYRAGASVPEVQQRLGHTTMRAAQIYAHTADDSDRILAERLDALYSTGPETPRLRAV